MRYQPEATSGNIVAIGDFNPAIFTPDWLESQQLIGAQDAQGMREAENLVITRQVAVLETDSFLLKIDEGRFQAHSKGVLTPALRDLAIGIFELVPHTPAKFLGQNFVTLFKFFDTDAYHLVGDVLAPKPIWQKLFPNDEHAIGLGSMTIQVQKGSRTSLKSKDMRNIIIHKGSGAGNSIQITYNDHHDLGVDRQGGTSSAAHAAEILRDTWENSWHEASCVVQQLIDLALAEQP